MTGMSTDRVPHPPKVMGVADLTMFYIVTGVSIRWIATAAAAGPSSLVIWVAGLFCFYLPLVLAVVELSSRYPDEGGLYVWTREAFGPFVGFMCGWSYSTSNLPYLPSILYFAAANALYVGGAAMAPLHGSPGWFIGFALAALALVTWLNIVGLGVGKWMHNLGSAGMWLPALIVVALGFASWRYFGTATELSPATMMPTLSLNHMILWSTLSFGLAGPEAASFMSGEIRNPRRTIPRALPIAGAAVVLCYVVGTAAVLLAVPAGQINSLQGLVQAATVAAGRLGVGWVVAPLAALIALGSVGAASGYLASCARIPFVGGVDRLLPAAFARLHPRWGTPVLPLILSGLLGGLFAVLGQAGTGVKGAYDVLVSMGIITTFLPFVLLFLAVIRFQRAPAGPEVIRLPGGPAVSIAVALLGLATTVAAIVLAVFPAPDEANKPLAFAKIVGLTGALLGAGGLVYALGRRRA